MKRPYGIAAVALLAASMVPGYAGAATVTLEPVVVTAARLARPQNEVPAQVTIIDQRQIAGSGATSVPALLAAVPGIIVTDLNGNGVNQRVDIGGFGETADRHVAVLVDGRRINPIDQAGVQWSTIPVDNIERIEVLRGGGSVLYGDNAMGGVINIITREPGSDAQANLHATRGSYDSMQVGGTVSGGWEKGAMRLDFSTATTDGYRDRSAADRQAINGRLWLYPLPDTTVTLDAGHASADYQYPGSLNQAQMAANRRQAVNQHDQGDSSLNRFGLGVHQETANYGSFNLEIAGRDEESASDIASWFSFMTFDKDSLGLLPSYTLEHTLAGRAATLLLGVDYYDNGYLAYSGFFKGATTNRFRIDKISTAGYLQEEVSLADHWSLNLGGRYEEPDYEMTTLVGGTETKRSWRQGEWAGNAGLAWHPDAETRVYGRLFRAFRYPAVDEFISLFTGTINGDLHQETSVGYELGARYRVLGLNLDLRLFRQDIDDEIAWNGTTFRNENIAQTRHQGAELGARLPIMAGLSLLGGLAYTDATFTTGGNDGKTLPLVPEWKGNVGAEWQHDSGLRARLTANYVGKRYSGGDYGNTMPQLDRHTTVDLYASYRYKQLELFLKGSNVFAEQYADSGWVGTYYPMPEAAWFGGFRLILP